MSATERLRELLDERGADYRVSATGYSIDIGPHITAYANRSDTTLDVSLRQVTPEQVIAATLGQGTCRQEEHGWSTEGDHARVWLTCGHDCMVETVADLPNYCPICGAEVMHA